MRNRAIESGCSSLQHVVASRAVSVMLLGLFAAGCRPEARQSTEEQIATARPYPIRLIVVDDAPLADVLERQWKARIENALTLIRMTADEMESARQLNADAVIYPSACLGTLAERGLIAPPSSEVLRDARYARQEVFDLQRHVEVRWGTSVVALSLGSPQLTLMYRADLLEALGAAVPAEWLELEQLARRLTREQLGAQAPRDDAPWSPLVQPSSPPWGAHVLLARAAAYATHPSQFSTLFDYTTMEPLIAGPPFERALRELVACHALDPDGGAAGWTPESARLAVLSGRAAMAFTWPSRVSTDETAPNVPHGARFGFAPLPGSATVYNFAEGDWTPRAHDARRVPCLGMAGRLGSVTHNARRPREVAGILALLSSREWSSDIAPHSAATTLFRRSHVGQPSVWTDSVLPEDASRQYAEAVEQGQSSPIYFFTVRIPGWRRYLAALDHAVAQACGGSATAAEALAEAAGAWNAITGELGLDAQRAAYTRSLGLDP